MLLDEHARELEDLLAKSLPAAAAVLTQLLDAADESVRLDAAKALFESWKYLNGGHDVTHVALRHHQAVLPSNGAAVASNQAAADPQLDEESAEELLSQVMGNEEDLAAADSEDLDENIGASAGKSTSPQSRPPGKAAPAKTKPKPADDDDAPPRVPKKYWIALGVCSLTLGVTWLASSAPPTPSGLAQTALTAEKPDDRQAAVAQLCGLQSPEVVPLLRRVLKESKDPAVLTDVMLSLGMRSDYDSVPQLVAALDDPAPNMQLAAFSTLTKILGPRAFRGVDLREENTPEKRAEAKRLATDKLGALKRMSAPPAGS